MRISSNGYASVDILNNAADVKEIYLSKPLNADVSNKPEIFSLILLNEKFDYEAIHKKEKSSTNANGSSRIEIYQVETSAEVIPPIL